MQRGRDAHSIYRVGEIFLKTFQECGGPEGPPGATRLLTLFENLFLLRTRCERRSEAPQIWAYIRRNNTMRK